MNGARDIVARATLPVCPVMHGESLPALLPGERRLLIACDGSYLEARSHALHVCLPLARFATPYARCSTFVRGQHGPLPRAMWAELCAAATAACPTEMVRLVVAEADGYRVVAPPVRSASAGHVRFDESAIVPGSLFIDAHSHGAGPAFFSATDDASDLSRPDLHVAVVFGRCGAGDRLELCARVAVAPYLIDIDVTLLGGS